MPKDIAPMFKGVPGNVLLPQEFYHIGWPSIFRRLLHYSIKT
jgi:hypothetical protein